MPNRNLEWITLFNHVCDAYWSDRPRGYSAYLSSLWDEATIEELYGALQHRTQSSDFTITREGIGVCEVFTISGRAQSLYFTRPSLITLRDAINAALAKGIRP
jgi:hypothetical protein